ncbi:MAG: class I SAM-dependent methyltransferase [bacterium]
MADRGKESVCPICGFFQTIPITRQDRPFRSCPACGLIWGVYTRTNEENDEFYRASALGDSISQSKRGLFDAVLERAEKSLGKPGRVLDIGCGAGAFLLVARERGWAAAGVEPIEELVLRCREQGLEAHTGHLKDLPKGAGLFDLITWWDVIMLVEDPLAEIRLAGKRLSPNGMLYLRVRQHGIVRQVHRLWESAGSLTNWKDPSVFHPWNFTPKSIRLLGRRVGVEMKVEAGRLSSGDSYRVSESGKPVAVLKQLVDTVSTTIGRLSNQQAILSPTMDVWGRPCGVE